VTGENEKARKAFEGALEGNPLSYRVNTRLAEMALASNKAAEAEGAARTALGAAPGYIPAHSALGRALVLTGKQSDAGPELQLVVDAGRASAVDELAYAEAALAMGQPDTAKAAVRRAKDKGAPSGQLTRVATLVDPALATEVNGAAAPKAAAPAPAPAPAAPVKRKTR
jgi:predicted Zn-dependent protease